MADARRIGVPGGQPGGAPLRIVRAARAPAGSGLPRSAYHWLSRHGVVRRRTPLHPGVNSTRANVPSG